MKRLQISIAAGLLAASALVPALADTVTLGPAADTFIISAAADNNAGKTTWIDAGTDGGNLGVPGVRRALLRFDLSSIPANSTITSAVLRLKVTKVPGNLTGPPVDSRFDLFRMNAEWTEGTKLGPNGALATRGETTWNSRQHSSAGWSKPGGDGDASTISSGFVQVNSTPSATYAFTGPDLVKDVQFWLTNSAQNFGWLLKAQDEAGKTVKGFGSLESGADAPRLEVGYQVAQQPNTPPLVSIQSPTNGANFAGPASVTIEVQASDADGTVTNVAFFNNGILLGNDVQSPFTFTASIFSGSHSLTAVAFDNQGTMATSAPVSIFVTNTIIQNPFAERIPKGKITVELRTIADGMASPIAMAVPGDGTGRFFVADQDGKIWVIANGARLPEPALDLKNRLVLLNAFDERGLLGMAVHPNFKETPLIYTYTSEPTNSVADFKTGITTNNHHSVIAEWRFSSSNSNRVDETSRRELMRVEEPQFNHNGGAMHFGPDGLLYVTLGDGGQSNDTGPGHVAGGNAQSLNVILGKMIRLDVNTRNSINGQYGIPPTNPFVGADGLDEIYAYGLRNPFTFSFDRSTGELWLADVGQRQVEEINLIVAGGNYGWNHREGSFWFDASNGNIVTDPTRPAPLGMIDPIAQYDHDDGLAIIGGFVYRGSTIPELVGKYVFGDWGNFAAPSGRLYYLDGTNGTKELIIGGEDRPLGLWLRGFGEDSAGELYVLANRWLGASGNTGRIMKIVPRAEPVQALIATTAPNQVQTTWTGGNGPFALQRKDEISQPIWTTALVTNERAAAVPPQKASGFFRTKDLSYQPPVPLTAHLSGGNEVPPNGSQGAGLGIFSLDGNTLTFSISYSGLSATATAAHIHGPALASGNGNVLINLAPFNGGAWGSAGSISGVLILSDAHKALLLAGKTYVNIHTSTNPGGEIRGQVAPVNMQVVLSGENENPAVQTTATGSGNLTLVGNHLTFNISYSGLTGPAVAAHIHGPAGPGASAPPIVDLSPFHSGNFGQSGAFSGTATMSPAQLAMLIDGLTYVNVHTTASTGGEIRGQVLANPAAVPLTTLLSGLAEKPLALTNSATGSGTFSLDGHTLNFNIAYAGLSGPATGAHIHGATNTTQNAPVMVNLAPYNGGTFGSSGFIAGTHLLTTEQRNALLSGLTYVNFHTAANPGGELRGQIAPVIMTAALSGHNERPLAADTTGQGMGTFALVRDQLAMVVAYRDLLSTATMAHIHGRAAFTGSAGVLVDLGPFNSGAFGTFGTLTGFSSLSVSNLAHVIDGQTYVNFHTTNYPGGEIRGHIMR